MVSENLNEDFKNPMQGFSAHVRMVVVYIITLIGGDMWPVYLVYPGFVEDSWLKLVDKFCNHFYVRLIYRVCLCLVRSFIYGNEITNRI